MNAYEPIEEEPIPEEVAYEILEGFYGGLT